MNVLVHLSNGKDEREVYESLEKCWFDAVRRARFSGHCQFVFCGEVEKKKVYSLNPDCFDEKMVVVGLVRKNGTLSLIKTSVGLLEEY